MMPQSARNQPVISHGSRGHHAPRQAERDAFEALIHAKAHMVLPEEPPAPPPPLPYTRAPEGNASSRRAGGRAELNRTEPPRVLVDVREFRCALPNLLHLHGTRVVPLTLEVGDYILHPVSEPASCSESES